MKVDGESAAYPSNWGSGMDLKTAIAKDIMGKVAAALFREQEQEFHRLGPLRDAASFSVLAADALIEALNK
jgi:hypothetical protein